MAMTITKIAILIRDLDSPSCVLFAVLFRCYFHDFSTYYTPAINLQYNHVLFKIIDCIYPLWHT